MTERLTDLLHEEADALVVPPAPPSEVLARGRRLRVRRRLAVLGGCTAVAVALASGALVTYQVTDSNPGPASQRRSDSGIVGTDLGAVFSFGTTVYLHDGATTASIPDKSIKSLYSTSAGVLVRHGNNPFSDGGGPQRFSLVTPDGTVQPIDVVTEETVASTDPTEPYLAYAVDSGNTVEVVVHDVATNTEVARVPVPDARDWGGWPAPPVALVGDKVYVGTADVLRVVDWRTGVVSETTTVPGGYPDIHGSLVSQSDRKSANLVDVVTGETVLTVPVKDHGYFDLSPDGRFASLSTGMGRSGTFDVYDVAARASVSLPPDDYGWTAEDQPFAVSGTTLTTCDPASGTCTTSTFTRVPPSGGDPEFADEVKLGGRTYES